MYANFIKEYIKNTRIIYAKEVSNALACAFELEAKQASFITNNFLKRQCDNHTLHRILKGVYCEIKQTPFGPVVVQTNEVITDFLLTNDNGYTTGPTFFNEIGLSSWLPAGTHITSNKYSTKAKENNIFIYKPVTEITKENKKYLQILDCIRDFDHYAIDSPNADKNIYHFIIENRLDLLQLIMICHYYYKEIVTKRLLDIIGKENEYVFA